MGALNYVWRKLTNTNAMQLASGKFEIDFFESVYRLIYFVGLSSSDFSVPYLIYSVVVKTSLVLLVFCELWHLFTVRWTIDGITNSTNVILIQIGAYYRYKVMSINKDIFKDLASSMESRDFDQSTSQRREILSVWQKRNESSLKLLLSLGTCTLMAWFTYPLMDDLDYNLMLELRLPFDYKTPALYPYVYMANVLSLFYISYFVMSTDLVMQSHLMHLLCQFAVLNDCFKNILTDCKMILNDERLDLKSVHLNVKFRKEYIKRLRKLVNQHVFILNNTLRLRDVMSVPMLAQLVCSTVLICSIGFQVATSVNVNLTKWLMSVFYLGYNMFVQYVICRWCEEIKIQSEGIGEAVYCSGWENGIVMVPGVRTSILLILARANKPVRLSAGGMYDLSLEAYATVVKASYTALTVLLRFR
ncbi:odorant receptor 13a-like [Bicyclus anynana]|uniref:Odorant receptor n=1 Tax=Bicyclus anynana TaxID=110368 RepID=A0A6J1NLP4_BICAN|nr:odorant receptor 13a-like [Bicyclus anynana]